MRLNLIDRLRAFSKRKRPVPALTSTSEVTLDDDLREIARIAKMSRPKPIDDLDAIYRKLEPILKREYEIHPVITASGEAYVYPKSLVESLRDIHDPEEKVARMLEYRINKAAKIRSQRPEATSTANF